MMKNCFLCLERTNTTEMFDVNSTLLLANNIKELIEKYLWPMEIVQTESFVCDNCWRALSEFNTFYIRIEEAHANLLNILKTEEESSENYIKTEVLMEPPISHEFVLGNNDIYIKKGETIDSQEVELKCDEITEDPLNKIKIAKKYSKDLKFKTTRLKENSKKALENVVTESLHIGNPTDTNSNSENTTNTKYSLSYNKKKRKNPDEKTGQEYDKFISENFQIVCSICQESIENFIALRKHFREQHKKRGFVVCCKKKIFSRPLLVDHIHIHLDANYFKCKECEKVYSERSTLESHMKMHKDRQQHRYHACETCGKSFVGLAQLENHKLTHATDYEKKYSCSECGKYFTTSYSLNYHIQAIHHNKFVNVCDICGKTMRCRNQFKLHREKHENKQSIAINCDICGLRLTDRRGLRRHKNSQHPVGGKKEYHCHLCLKVSPNQEALKTHIRLTHGTNFNHKCTMCDKAFKRPYALREHMATHTGTALYTCPWCPKTFISNGNMHNHRKKSHPKEWEEAHQMRFSSKFVSEQTEKKAKDINAV